ncbi:type IV pilin N-terminal domain-containing protein [Halosimplex pelagicum]|uniref:Type IV pilin N-terminal domain-containing protein n=1 Tax=Halosimplex pelagicum TaxID=869886 RepID=A0A7D5T390_9EURY|nr:type IV pilin N-terminal domain-containing protein [Halosimplex pelagicum]QLH81811.1 type IV pilin N-terminal domain-containing protein [Halosimplex pelagicum]
MRSRRARRGLSPVIGTVLLVAIAVLLASAAAYVAFGATEEREPAPEVTMDLEPGERPAAYELELTNGERLDGEKVALRGAADENALRNRDLLAGDSVAVFPVRERLQLVWFGEHGSSYVLREFEVEPGVPEADRTCPWLEGEKADGASTITIDFVLECDVVAQVDITLETGGVVVGSIDSRNGNVDIDNGDLTVYGPVAADQSVDIDDANVVGSVSADDDIAVDGAEIWGDVRGPDVDVDTATVQGSVRSANQVDLDGVTVTGHVYAPSVSCSDSPTIDGEPCSSYAPKDPSDY